MVILRKFKSNEVYTENQTQHLTKLKDNAILITKKMLTKIKTHSREKRWDKWDLELEFDW